MVGNPASCPAYSATSSSSLSSGTTLFTRPTRRASSASSAPPSMLIPTGPPAPPLHPLVRDAPVHEPNAAGLFRFERLAEHAHLHRSPEPDYPGQEERDAGVGDEPYLDESHRELRALGRDAQITGQGYTQPRTINR